MKSDPRPSNMLFVPDSFNARMGHTEDTEDVNLSHVVLSQQVWLYSTLIAKLKNRITSHNPLSTGVGAHQQGKA